MAEMQREGMGGLTSFVLGALTGAAAVMLMRKENREKIREVYHDIKAKGEKIRERAKRQAERAGEEIKERARE